MRTIDRTDKSATPRCNYCGATSPEDGFETRRVIHRANDTRKPEVVTSLFTVCKGTACGGNLKMAHEG
jgi:hypothetical protein